MQLANPFGKLTRQRVGQHWQTLGQQSGERPEGLPLQVKPLVAIAQLSDPHICDAQSPLRASYFDRLSDPHHPISSMLPGPLGGYRAQEALTTQVLESMIRTLNQIETAPLSGLPLSLLLLTGDLADNMQQNELTWVSKLLSGGEVLPSSGRENDWHGPGSLHHYSPHYWNPESTPVGAAADSPSTRYEFPKIAGLWNLATRRFQAHGTKMPWAAVHGNHDGLIQGTIAGSAETRSLVVGENLAIDFRTEGEALQFLSRFGPSGPADWPAAEMQIFAKTAADGARGLASESTWHDLGFSNSKDRYWRLEVADLVILGLDTCNPWGGWDGSIDIKQFEWLQQTLDADAERRVLVVSHHPQHRLGNTWGGAARELRIGGDSILEALNRHGGVLAWFAGHTHRHHIARLPSPAGLGILSIETASLIDWPQQGRILEIFESQSGELHLASTTINHIGATSPIAEPGLNLETPDLGDPDLLLWLAGLSRQLAVNDWQRQSGTYSIANLEGEASARDFVVRI